MGGGRKNLRLQTTTDPHDPPPRHKRPNPLRHLPATEKLWRPVRDGQRKRGKRRRRQAPAESGTGRRRKEVRNSPPEPLSPRHFSRPGVLPRALSLSLRRLYREGKVKIWRHLPVYQIDLALVKIEHTSRSLILLEQPRKNGNHL